MQNNNKLTKEDIKYINDPFNQYDLQYIEEINTPEYGFKQYYYN